MFIQHFKKKENQYKDKGDKIYFKILREADTIIKKKYLKEQNFDSTFELISMFLIFYMKCFNMKESKNNKMINEGLIKIFISDLDKSFREVGIGDMSIGKYVKKYVKKFYYRVKILDSLFNDFDNSNKIANYLHSLKTVDDKKIIIMSEELIGRFKDIKKNILYI
jgi:hypothetical protein